MVLAAISTSVGQVEFRPPTPPATRSIDGQISSRLTSHSNKPKTRLHPLIQESGKADSKSESTQAEFQFAEPIESDPIQTLGSSIAEPLGGEAPATIGNLNSVFPTTEQSNFPGFTPRQDPSDAADTNSLRDGLREFMESDSESRIPFLSTQEDQDGETEQTGANQDDREQLPEAIAKRFNGTETIIQRFPNGKKRISREVAADENGNIRNHGLWEAFNLEGRSIASGTFDQGIMQGQWKREHSKSEGGLFETKPFNMYQGPFLSVANFKDGKLDGLWTIYDQFQSKIFEISYEEGVRHGTATWWYPNRAKMREATFKEGLLHGFILGWDEADKPTRREEYVEGRQIVRNTTFYRPDQPKNEEYFLDAKLVPEGQDKWWEAEPTPYLPRGNKVQNGGAAQWYENGQLKKQGQFKEGEPIGQFVWWHPNGNKQILGIYRNGAKDGLWTWWHANGMKQTQGRFKNDLPVGVWKAWYDDGKLRNDEDFSGDDIELAQPDNGNGNPDSKPSINAPDPTDPANPNEPLETNGVNSAQPKNGESGNATQPEELPDPLPEKANMNSPAATEKKSKQTQAHDFREPLPADEAPKIDSDEKSGSDDGSIPKELFEENGSSETESQPGTTTLNWKSSSDLQQ